MQHALSQSWWMWMLRGLVSVIFGILAFTMPGITFSALMTLFAAFMLVDGILTLGGLIFKKAGDRPWWSTLLEGILGISVGILTFILPGVTALVFITFLAFWAIVTGFLEIVSAVRLRKEIEGEWALGLAGVLSIILGLAFVINPGVGLVTVTWMLGAYTLAFGVLMMVLGARLRQLLKAASKDNMHFPMRPA